MLVHSTLSCQTGRTLRIIPHPPELSRLIWNNLEASRTQVIGMWKLGDQSVMWSEGISKIAPSRGTNGFFSSRRARHRRAPVKQARPPFCLATSSLLVCLAGACRRNRFYRATRRPACFTLKCNTGEKPIKFPIAKNV